MSYFGGGPINLGPINPHNNAGASNSSSGISDVLRRFKSGASSLGSAAGRPLSWAKRNWWDETPTSYQRASNAYSAASAAAAAEAAAAQAAAQVTRSQGSDSSESGSGSGGSGSIRSLLKSLGLGSGSSSNSNSSGANPSSTLSPSPSPSAAPGFAPEPRWATPSPAGSVSSGVDPDKSFTSTTTADGVVSIGVNFKKVLEEMGGSIDKPISCITIDERTGKPIEVVISQQDGVNQIDLGPAGTIPSVSSSQSNPNPNPNPNPSSQSQPQAQPQAAQSTNTSTPGATTFSQQSQPRTSAYQRLAEKGRPYGWGSRVPHPEHEIDLDQPPSTVADGKSLYDSICSDGDLSKVGRKYALLENTTAALQRRYQLREPDGSTSSALDFPTARQQAYIWLDNQLSDPSSDKSLSKAFQDHLTHTYLTSRNSGQPVPFIINSEVELPSVWDPVDEKVTNDGDTVSQWIQKRAWELTSRGLTEDDVKSVIKDLINDTDKARSQYSKRFGLSESSELARMAAFDLVNSGISTGNPQISQVDSTLSSIILGMQLEQSERQRNASTSAPGTDTGTGTGTGTGTDSTMYSVRLPDGRSVTLDAEQLAELRSRMPSQQSQQSQSQRPSYSAQPSSFAPDPNTDPQMYSVRLPDGRSVTLNADQLSAMRSGMASQPSQSQIPSFSTQPSSFGTNTGFNPSTGIPTSMNTGIGSGMTPLRSAMRGSNHVQFV